MRRKQKKWKFFLGILLFIFSSSLLIFWLHQLQHTRIKNKSLKIGLESYNECNWKRSAANLGRYLALCPTDVNIFLKYADAQLHIRPCGEENIKQAIAAYRTVIRNDNNNKVAVEQLMNLYLRIDAAQEAENIGFRYLKSNKDYNIQTIYAVSLINQRKYEPAANILKTILSQSPNTITAYIAMAKLSQTDIEGHFGVYNDWLSQCTKNNPLSAKAFILCAAYHIDDNKYTSAEKELEIAEQLDLSDADTRIDLAIQFYRIENISKAKENLEIIKKCCPGKLSLWNIFAKIALYENNKTVMNQVADEGMLSLQKDPWDFMPIAAELKIRAGNLTEANKYIERLKLNETEPSAIKWLEGLLAQAKGKDYEAIRNWKIAAKMGFDSEKITPELLNSLLRAGDEESALTLLRQKAIEQPERYRWHFLLARLAFEQQKFSEALAHSQTAMSLRPNFVEPFILNVKIRMYLPQGTDEIPKCENYKNIYEQLTKINFPGNNNIEIELLKFACSLECGEFEKSQKILSELQKIDPNLIEVEMASIEFCVAKNLTDDAILKLNKLIDKYPQNIMPITYLIELLIQENKRYQCESIINNAILRIDDMQNKRKLVLILANIYKDMNEKTKELGFLVQTLQKMPDDIPIRKELFDLYMEDTQLAKAQFVIDEVKELEGIEGKQWKYLQAKLWSADVYFENHYSQIITMLQENLSINPYDNASRLLLANVYEKASENQMALITYRAALNQRPYDINIKTRIIDNLFKIKEYDTAESLLDETIKQDYVNGNVLKLNLRNLLRQNRISEAIEFIEKIDVPEENKKSLNLLNACLKIKLKDYDGARKILDIILQQDPYSFQVKSLLVELNICTNNFGDAIDLCNQMATQNKNGYTLMLRGHTYSAVGKIENAQKDYDDAAALEPNNADVFEARGFFYRSIGKFENAFNDLEKAYQLQLSNIDIVKYMLNSLADMNSPADVWKCQQLLKHALSNYPEDPELLWYKARLLVAENKPPSLLRAENILEDVTKNNPKFSSGWSLLAEIYLNEDKTNKAMNTILEGLKNCGNDKILLVLKAKSEMRISPEMAILTLEHLAKHSPEDTEIALLLSDSYLSTGQNQKAIELLENYEQKSPLSQKNKIGTALAMALFKDGKNAQAWEKLNQLSTSDPNNYNISITKCQIYFLKKEWEGLKTQFTDILLYHPQAAEDCLKNIKDFLTSSDPPPPSISEYLIREILKYKPEYPAALLMLAINLQNNKQYEQAAEIYQKLLKIDKDNKIAINNLAWIYCESYNKYRDALELADYGLKLHPDYASLRDTRGLIFYRFGDFQKASEDFLESMQLNDKKASSYVISMFHLGLTLNKTGDCKNAYTYIEKAITLNQIQGGLNTNEVAEAQNILTFLPMRSYAADTNK